MTELREALHAQRAEFRLDFEGPKLARRDL